ncbi:hypothetical protein GUJ93_ZPchr0012g19615 [Zizania palustris]|uniref:Uncharacterized protein n=1 Tax=Zizania palustris TaxID=103762 RepID=A0A8J5WUI5_ZIZPA|nr:hypothetical protein GUJ93_ZPchr0012g19615 [Zizania palustris]
MSLVSTSPYISQRCKDGQCFHCDERFSVDHKLIYKQLFNIELIDDDDVTLGIEDDLDPTISLHAITGARSSDSAPDLSSGRWIWALTAESGASCGRRWPPTTRCVFFTANVSPPIVVGLPLSTAHAASSSPPMIVRLISADDVALRSLFPSSITRHGSSYPLLMSLSPEVLRLSRSHPYRHESRRPLRLSSSAAAVAAHLVVSSVSTVAKAIGFNFICLLIVVITIA